MNPSRCHLEGHAAETRRIDRAIREIAADCLAHEQEIKAKGTALNRYRMEALPIEGAEPREWSPLGPSPAKPAQGWLPFNDGSQLGTLFNTTTTTEAK